MIVRVTLTPGTRARYGSRQKDATNQEVAQVVERIQNFIDGAWVDPSSGQWKDNINPAKADEVINQWPDSTADDMHRAIAAAKAAQPGWANVPAPARGKILFEAVRIMERRKDELARALSLEEGKIHPESVGEVQKTINLLEFLAGEGRRLNGQTTHSEIPSTFTYTVRVPLGVVGLITPWNFPVAIPVWKAAPALICGNTCVLKPAEQTPTVSRIITEIFTEAGVPPGVFNLVYGRGGEVGEALVKHPDVAALSFTGSTQVGLSIYAEAAKQNKKMQAEMGGKNPLILMDDGDLEMAIAATVKGAFGATGQRCTATSRAIVHEAVYDAFVARIVEEAAKQVPGDGFDPASTLGPSVDARQLETVLRYIEVAKEEGVTIACGGARITKGSLARGYFVEPTVLTGVNRNHRVAREEIFGPVLSVIKVGSFDEAIDVANDSDFGLSSAIYTANVNRVFRYLERVNTGMLHVNNPTIGGEAHLPFGGMKSTCVGDREQGQTAIEFFSQLKTAYVDFTGQLRKSNIF